MEVDIQNLKEVTNRLFHHLDELGISKIELNDDFYWNIPKEQLYDPYKEPEKLTMGQLTDDWNDLRKILNGEMDEIAYNFVDLSAILKAIGEKVIS